MTFHKKTPSATGYALPYTRDLFRIAVTLPTDAFSEVKISAMKNNRSMSAEIRTIVEAAVNAARAKEIQG